MKTGRVLSAFALALSLMACRDVNSDVPTTTLPQGTTREILYVAQNKATCYALIETTCLLVKHSPAEKWSLFYDPIQGFDYQAGNRYKLTVLVSKYEIQPTDMGDRKYVLEKMLAKIADSTVAEIGK